MTSEEFVKHHFKGVEKETWYPAIVAIAEGFAKQEVKSIERKVKLCTSAINGALDGLELDNTCDVVEKSTMIDILKELLKQLT